MSITVCSSTFEINTAIMSLVARLKNDTGATMAIGLDAEWNVDMDACRAGVPDPRRIAVLQLAYDDHI